MTIDASTDAPPILEIDGVTKTFRPGWGFAG